MRIYFLILGMIIGFGIGLVAFKDYHKSHHQWVGKMNYYLSLQDIQIEDRFYLQDTTMRKIELKYAKRATDYGYNPYGEDFK